MPPAQTAGGRTNDEESPVTAVEIHEPDRGRHSRSFGRTGVEAAAAAEGQDADLVVFNAKVYTVDSRAPKAEAFAVKAGRFTAVGSTRTSRRSSAKARRPSMPSR